MTDHRFHSAATLAGQLLVAMPGMEDPRFSRSVIYLCAHSEQGAMGLIVNKPLPSMSFSDLLSKLEVERTAAVRDLPIHLGGPVETSRGFVLHSLDYTAAEATLDVDGSIGLTATLDIVRAIARGEGPWKALMALGYSGWGAGQLEGEIKANGWLNCPADDEIVFGEDFDRKWQRAIAKLGIDPSQLSSSGGTA